MKSLATFLFMCNAAQIFLNGSALPVSNSSPQVVHPRRDSSFTQCARIRGNATDRQVPFYSHSVKFGDAVTPKDVQAFKYYCTNNMIKLLIEEENIEVNIST